MILIAALFGDHAERGLKRCQSASQKPGYATANPDPALQTASPGQSRARPFQSVYKQLDCLKPGSKEEYDSCQQWRSAEATAQQACVAELQFWVGGWISVFGLAGLLGTIVYAAKSARAAGDAAKEMAREVEVQIRAEGPFLFVEEIVTTDNAPSTITVRVRNAGKSPAILIEWTLDCQTHLDTLPAGEPTYGRPKPLADINLTSEGLPRPLWWYFFGEKLEPTFDNDAPAVLWGYILYKDIFGRRRKRGFGFRTAYNRLMGALANESGQLLWDSSGGEDYNYDREYPSEPKGTRD
jgi:hypothetical protein